MTLLGLITTFGRDVNTILRHKSVYKYLLDEAPYLIELIRNEDLEKRAALVREVGNMFYYSHTRT